MDAVGSHEQVRLGVAAVFKIGADGAIGSFFIVQKSLVELHAIFQACQRDAPQGDAADRAMPGDGVFCAAGPCLRPGEVEQLVQLLGDYAEAPRKVTACGLEKIPEMLGQTSMECHAALGIDVNAISLRACIGGLVPLIDGEADSCLLQSVRQAKPTHAAADDCYVEGAIAHFFAPIGFCSFFFALAERIHVSVIRSIASIWPPPDAARPAKIAITMESISRGRMPSRKVPPATPAWTIRSIPPRQCAFIWSTVFCTSGSRLPRRANSCSASSISGWCLRENRPSENSWRRQSREESPEGRGGRPCRVTNFAPIS